MAETKNYKEKIPLSQYTYIVISEVKNENKNTNKNANTKMHPILLLSDTTLVAVYAYVCILKNTNYKILASNKNTTEEKRLTKTMRLAIVWARRRMYFVEYNL